MSLRLDTTAASADSTAWQPAGETILQLKATSPSAEVLVQAKVHADADWVTLATLRAAPANPDLAFVRLPKMPNLRLSVGRNTNGSAIKVWDGE